MLLIIANAHKDCVVYLFYLIKILTLLFQSPALSLQAMNRGYKNNHTCVTIFPALK